VIDDRAVLVALVVGFVIGFIAHALEQRVVGYDDRYKEDR
jgi:uncharacterized membrane-anchored protein YhcB (DUF1043 family)